MSTLALNIAMYRLSDNLKKLLGEANVTIYEVSKDTGIPRSNLDNWVKGKAKVPREDYLNKLAEYFQVTPKYLLFGDNDNDIENQIDDRIMRLARRLQDFGGRFPGVLTNIINLINLLLQEVISGSQTEFHKKSEKAADKEV